MRRARKLLVVAIASLTLALIGVGCGGSDDENATGATPSAGGDEGPEEDAESIDACTLLTDEEAAEILGGPATSGPGTGPGASVCTWSDVTGRTVTISVGSPGTAPGGRFDPGRVNGLGTEKPVAGFDGAFYVGIGTVAFATDDRLHTVQVATGSAAGEDQAAAEELAPIVRDRLG